MKRQLPLPMPRLSPLAYFAGNGLGKEELADDAWIVCMDAWLTFPVVFEGIMYKQLVF